MSFDPAAFANMTEAERLAIIANFMNTTTPSPPKQTKRSGGRGVARVDLIGGHVAANPVFFPGQTEKSHCAKFPLIINRGTVGDGDDARELTTVIPVSCWGRAAMVASHFCPKGTRVDVVGGHIASILKATGQIKNGKPEQVQLLSVNVNGPSLHLGPPTMKEMRERFDAKIAEARATGTMDTLTGEKLLAITKTPMVDFDMNVALATGRYGCARVWSKAHNGYVGPQNPDNTDAPAPNPEVMGQFMNMFMSMFQKMAENTAPTPATEVVSEEAPEAAAEVISEEAPEAAAEVVSDEGDDPFVTETEATEAEEVNTAAPEAAEAEVEIAMLGGDTPF